MKKCMRVAICGDFCARAKEDILNVAYGKQYLEELLPLLETVDYRILNLETAVSDAGTPISKSGPNLNSNPKSLEFFAAGKFDCAVMANNHTGDFGEDGLLETMQRVDDLGIDRVGAGQNLDEAYRPLYVERGGVRLAIIAICENEFGTAGLTTPGTASFDQFRAEKAIREAKQNADFVLVINHGGNEHNPIPSPRVVGRYRCYAMQGADAVIGMHPHCMQGREVFENKPIAYSTGNFFFHTTVGKPFWYFGYVPVLTFVPGESVQMELVPYHFDVDVTHLEVLQGERKALVEAYLDQISQPLSDPIRLRDFFYGWCTIKAESHLLNLGKYDPEFYHLTQIPPKHPILGCRNVLTCEAHNELVTTFARMIVEGNQEIGKRMKPVIEQLQEMPF